MLDKKHISGSDSDLEVPSSHSEHELAERHGDDAAKSLDPARDKCQIEVKDAVLRYPIGPYRRGSLKSSLMRLIGHKELNQQVEYVTALKGMNLSIHQGERIGIIGRNGSGKSSLLRAIAGVYPLRSGSIHVRGMIGSLLDISLGFETESTGRENIYNRGFSMGLTRSELAKHEADIIEFADLGEFIDMPMRTYSSGMFVRLGFSISTQFTPDILLVDEVFGAGDANFAVRAQKRMEAITDRAGIVVMVSHDFAAIVNNCDRAIWIDKGEIVFDGPVDQAIDTYLTKTR